MKPVEMVGVADLQRIQALVKRLEADPSCGPSIVEQDRAFLQRMVDSMVAIGTPIPRKFVRIARAAGLTCPG